MTRDGKPVAKLVRVESGIDAPSPDQRRADGKVFYKGEWMIPAAAERERSIERLHGRVKILGDIISPIDDVDSDDNGPLAGTIVYQGDLVSPLDEEWDADK